MLYSELNVSPQLHQAVERMGFTEMTEIQEKVIPVMMAGRDVIAKAPTGTGKTCAFGIPVIESLNQELARPQTVVLAPTRELAQQIAGDLEDLAHFMPAVRIACVYGGANMQGQIDRLKKGCQIVVATPGRLMDHVRHRTIDLGAVTTVVLDEADEMLNMGFYKDVRHIIDLMKARKHLSMFSATISREVMDIGWLYQKDAAEVTVQPVQESLPKITQYKLKTTGRDKLADLAQIILSALLGLFGIAAALNGNLFHRIPWLFRVALVAGGLCMMIPGTVSDLIGFALLAGVVLWQKASAKKTAAA